MIDESDWSCQDLGVDTTSEYAIAPDLLCGGGWLTRLSVGVISFDQSYISSTMNSLWRNATGGTNLEAVLYPFRHTASQQLL